MAQFVLLIITIIILGWQLCRCEVLVSTNSTGAWEHIKVILLLFITNFILFISGWYSPLISAIKGIGN